MRLCSMLVLAGSMALFTPDRAAAQSGCFLGQCSDVSSWTASLGITQTQVDAYRSYLSNFDWSALQNVDWSALLEQYRQARPSGGEGQTPSASVPEPGLLLLLMTGMLGLGYAGWYRPSDGIDLRA